MVREIPQQASSLVHTTTPGHKEKVNAEERGIGQEMVVDVEVEEVNVRTNMKAKDAQDDRPLPPYSSPFAATGAGLEG